MNIYDAIMKAADQIESHPERFDYWASSVPRENCRTPGCAIGWIGAFAGCSSFTQASVLVGGDSVFYKRMWDFSTDWDIRPSSCAKGLRLYARKYHAPTRKTDAELVKHWVAVARQMHYDENAKSEELIW